MQFKQLRIEDYFIDGPQVQLTLLFGGKKPSEPMNWGIKSWKGWSNVPRVFNITRLIDFTSCSSNFYLAGVQVLPFFSFVFVLFLCCWCSLSLLDAGRRWPIRAELFSDLTCFLTTTFIRLYVYFLSNCTSNSRWKTGSTPACVAWLKCLKHVTQCYITAMLLVLILLSLFLQISWIITFSKR